MDAMNKFGEMNFSPIRAPETDIRQVPKKPLEPAESPLSITDEISLSVPSAQKKEIEHAPVLKKAEETTVEPKAAPVKKEAESIDGFYLSPGHNGADTYADFDLIGPSSLGDGFTTLSGDPIAVPKFLIQE